MKEFKNGKPVSSAEEKEGENGNEGTNEDCKKEGDDNIELKEENENPVFSEEQKEEEAEQKVYCKTEGHKEVIYIEMKEFKNGKPITNEEEKKEDEQEEGAEGQDKNEVEGEKKDEGNEKKENGQDGLDGTEIDVETLEEGLLDPPYSQTEEDERAYRQVIEYFTECNVVISYTPPTPPSFRPPVLPEDEELNEVAVGVNQINHVAVSMGDLTETSSSEEENGNPQAENPEENEDFQVVSVPRYNGRQFVVLALDTSSSEVSDEMDEDATDADREDNDDDKEEAKKYENGNKKVEDKKDENGNKEENDENRNEGNHCGKKMEDGKTEGGVAEGEEDEKEEHDENEQLYNFIFMSYEEKEDGDQKKVIS